jgi:hypothetical protein
MWIVVLVVVLYARGLFAVVVGCSWDEGDWAREVATVSSSLGL